ncbi:DUF1800 domain-containing protein [Dyella flagellata]|uniref:DUF1800 domain-containing protein n=1 Tax=Dyella flagellata TaxID=1867833 RepID=A0ABQ5XCY8_9GAMM|nr:DUF1800 family protein [Dyella flagellata]GLQ89172.1 hypothetical protein GCM10007898_27440 [Dyella flagellata]
MKVFSSNWLRVAVLALFLWPAFCLAQVAGPYTDAEAARFLAQATFGPTTADIAHLRQVGYQGWLNEQFAAPVSTEKPYLDWVAGLPNTPDGNNTVNDDTRMEAWWINALGTPDPSRGMRMPTDQLRQRVALALSEIFVVSNANGTLAYEPYALASWHDMLAADAFGNYRTLLEDVTKSPAMATYLSMLANQKADPTQNIHPDENYAREVMQLFSIGLVQLNTDGTPKLDANNQPIPTYDQTVVRGMAAVFTGWNWNNATCTTGSWPCCTADTYTNCGPSDTNSPAWWSPLQPIADFHDSTSDKQLLNYPGVALSNGILIHGGDAQTEMTAALDNIFHHPNVGPFIARRLIQRLVTSNPTPGYVSHIAQVFNDDGSSAHVRGNLQAVVQAILLDPEAVVGASYVPNPDAYGKLREPLLKLTHLWRAMGAETPNGRVDTPYPEWESTYGQAPLRSPSVFNFFKPDFQQPGELSQRGLFGPEFQVYTATTAVTIPNDIFHRIFCDYTTSTNCYSSGGPNTMSINADRDAVLALNNPSGLIDLYNLLFMSGQMSSFMHDTLLTRLNAMTDNSDGTLGRQRVQHALYLIINSPEYSVQK